MIDKDIVIESLGIYESEDDIIEYKEIYNLYYVKFKDGNYYSIIGRDDILSKNEDDIKMFLKEYEGGF